MLVSLIAAVAQNGVIGANNTIPWNSKEDMKFFKEKTLNHPVIMGRKTYDSLRIQPLPKRFNVIITKDQTKNGLLTEGECGPLYMNSIVEALDYLDGDSTEVFIIGGTQIYTDALAMDVVDRMYINVMNDAYEGDALFPYYDSKDWTTQQSEIKYNDFKSYTLFRKKEI